jgi:hypothetical protein
MTSTMKTRVTEAPPANQGVHVVSALYCPDGQRYEWRTDERGAELLRRAMAEQERKFGGEWVDVWSRPAPNALDELLNRHGVRGY